MSGKLTKLGYQRLVQEDLDWLSEQPRTLESDHIAQVLAASIDHEYPPQVIANIDHWDHDWIEINWVWEGKGFGQLVIHKTPRGVITDAEYMSRDSVRQILGALADSLRLNDEEEAEELSREPDDDHP